MSAPKTIKPNSYYLILVLTFCILAKGALADDFGGDDVKSILMTT